MTDKGSDRIPSLDGFRALSILLVLFGHLCGTRGFPVSLETYERMFGDVAELGVIVFFVISGYLITTLLEGERQATGRISLKQFYLRRLLRIFPVAYAFIAAMALATLIGWVQLTGRDFLLAATYLMNYHPERPWVLGHLWSLSIEEQYYLAWPLALIVLRRRQAMAVAVAAIFLGPIVRLAPGMELRMFHATWFDGMTIFPSMMDYLATGCVLALLRPRLLQQSWYLRLTASRWLVLTVPLILLVTRESTGGHLHGIAQALVVLIGSPVMNACIALSIESCTRHTGTLAARFLNGAPVAFVGVLSYSLYVWQQPFIDRGGGSWWNAFPQNLVCAFAMALLSYWIVERSFLALRRRFRPPVGSAGVVCETAVQEA
ncbi:MAG TPA: acyltransferase [Xanthomonadaceae bacterium]|jgi:peptidoglycan/LPS O-acetylase OafA/YrhL